MRIHHVALRTSDVPRLEAFYAGILGLRVIRRDGTRSVWLDAAGAILMVEERSDAEPGVPPGSRDLLAFDVAGEDCVQCMNRLEKANLSVESRTLHTVYLRDPDGRRIGLSVYPALLAQHHV